MRRTFDYDGRVTADYLARMFLASGVGPTADLVEAYDRFHAMCNGIPTVGVPSSGEFVDAMLAAGCRLGSPFELPGDPHGAREPTEPPGPTVRSTGRHVSTVEAFRHPHHRNDL